MDTVTAQLLYEIGGPAYLNPDVTARFDSIQLSADGPDRVRISGVRGDSPPVTTKVALNYQGGWRSTITLYLTGLDIEAKAVLAQRALWSAIPGGRDAFDSVDIALLRTDKPDPRTNAEAMAQLRITVKDADEHVVGRAFSARVTELALACYPGLFGGGRQRRPAFGVYWPAVVPAAFVRQEVVIGGRSSAVEAVPLPRPAGRGRGGAFPPRPPARAPAGGPRRAGRPCGRRWAGWPGPGRGTRAATPTSACGPAPTRLRVAGRLPERQAEGAAARDRAAAGRAARAA